MGDKKIAWEKFTTHRDANSEKGEDIEEETTASYQNQDQDEDGQEEAMFALGFMQPPPKIKTPFGEYDDKDPFSPYNMFDCWIGHANFRITHEDFDLLDKKIDGIGCLKVLSTYRFFIGLEKLFPFSTARIQIQKELCKNLLQSEIISNDFESVFQNALGKINDTLLSIKDSERWAVFIGKNGTVESINSSDFDSDHEYQSLLKKLKTLKNGNIITCDSL